MERIRLLDVDFARIIPQVVLDGPGQLSSSTSGDHRLLALDRIASGIQVPEVSNADWTLLSESAPSELAQHFGDRPPMPLVLSLKQKTSIPLEVDTIRLETVREQSADAVLRTLVQYGNTQVALGEFFHAGGSASDNELVWEGDCSHVKLIGTHLSTGRIRVVGNAGMHLGAEMKGGEIVVDGNVADWVGAEMHGGRITVKGNAGHLVGACYRGGRRGMTGGEIFIHGDAGNEIGLTMRRGLIAVGGRSGDATGFNLIAGTILLFGENGIRPGAGMRRGTIGLLSGQPGPDILPTFRLACRYEPVFLQLYLRHLRTQGFPVHEAAFTATYDRWCGDLLELGKGEILVRLAA